MKLIFFGIEHERSYDMDSPLAGKVDFSLETGQKMSVGLNHAQVEQIATAVCEMVLVQLREAARQVQKNRLEIPKAENLLERE